MADPAIQAFCCVKLGKRAVSSLYSMLEFNSSQYNTVCLVSSFIGILGASYQILPKNSFQLEHRWIPSVCTRSRRIIVYLAVADLLASIGVFTRSVINLYPTIVDYIWQANVGGLFCASISAWIQYWYCVTWFWTLCYTIDFGLALQDKQSRPLYYHLFSWLVPAVITILGFLYVYIPDSVCIELVSGNENIFTRMLPNYIATYLPMLSVMVLNPLLYCYAGSFVQNMVLQGYGQYTNRERDIVDSTYWTFTAVNFVFYTCWLPNLIASIIVWTMWENLPVNTLIALWYIMAVVNPLQAFFNCLVYNHFSRKLNLPWAPPLYTEESTPLLSGELFSPKPSTSKINKNLR